MSPLLLIKNSNFDKSLDDFLKKTKKELEAFFKIKIAEPNIFLLDSRKELDLIWGQKTESWVVGGTKFGLIYILDPKAYIKESSHTDKNDFWRTLKHEYCHIFYKTLTGGYTPLWLHEGLALYLAGQKKKCRQPLDVFFYFYKPGPELYGVGYYWVEFLIKKFGKDKMLSLINGLKEEKQLTEKSFSKLFFSVYGFKYNKTHFAKAIN